MKYILTLLFMMLFNVVNAQNSEDTRSIFNNNGYRLTGFYDSVQTDNGYVHGYRVLNLSFDDSDENLIDSLLGLYIPLMNENDMYFFSMVDVKDSTVRVVWYEQLSSEEEDVLLPFFSFNILIEKQLGISDIKWIDLQVHVSNTYNMLIQRLEYYGDVCKSGDFDSNDFNMFWESASDMYRLSLSGDFRAIQALSSVERKYGDLIEGMNRMTYLKWISVLKLYRYYGWSNRQSDN